MSRLMLVPSLLCAVFLSACQTTAPSQNVAASSSTGVASAAQPQTVPTVEFRLAQTRAAQNLAELRLSDGSIWMLPQPVLSRQDLAGITPLKNKEGQAFISFSFNAAGAKKLAAITQQNVGNLLVLSVNGNLAAIPRIGSPMMQGVLNIPVASEQQALDIANRVAGNSRASSQQRG